MRLIDADKLKHLYPENKAMHNALNHAKTVKAMTADTVDKMMTEIEEFAKNPDFGDLSIGATCGAMRALEIINKHRNGGVV